MERNDAYRSIAGKLAGYDPLHTNQPGMQWYYKEDKDKMKTFKSLVCDLLGKTRYEPKSERVRRSAKLRRHRRHRYQLAGTTVALFVALCVMVTGGFAVGATGVDEPEAKETSTAYKAASLSSPMTTLAEHAVPTLFTMTDSIEEQEEPNGVTTSRLGVYIDTYDPDTDYTALMNELIDTLEVTDDENLKLHLVGLLEIYECQRNLKVEDLYPDSEYTTSNLYSSEHSLEEIETILFPEPEPTSYFTYTEEDAIRLARIVYAEAGSSWITNAHQRDVASVVMNRVLDSRFPDTIEEVINAPGQYPGTCKNLKYDERSLANAIYVLENGPTCSGIFQANFVQGSTIVATYSYPGLSMTTYICR